MWKRKTECDTSRDRPPRGALNLENKGKASRKYLNKSFCWIVGCCRHALLRSLSYFSKERATRTRPSSTSSLSCFCCTFTSLFNYIFGIKLYAAEVVVHFVAFVVSGMALLVMFRIKVSFQSSQRDTCRKPLMISHGLPHLPHTELI